jgi:hypothetical protein
MTINTYNDAQGPMGSNGIIVVSFHSDGLCA